MILLLGTMGFSDGGGATDEMPDQIDGLDERAKWLRARMRLRGQ